MRANWNLLTEEKKTNVLNSTSVSDADELDWWRIHYARDSQLAPDGDWLVWLIQTGRGWGKTRTACEEIQEWVESGKCKRIHLVAATAADARDTMVEGEAGLLAIAPDRCRPEYEPSKRRLTWPNGAIATLFSAEEPNRLRGPACDGWWADELAAWKYCQETWDQLQFGARLGKRVRGIITTTPRPIKLLKEIIAEPTTHVTRGHTYENKANLAPSFLAKIRDRYEGTRLGRQELAGEILDDNPDALWRREWIDRDRVTRLPEGVELSRVVVALDPSATTTGDEAGIVVVGKGSDKHFYIMADSSIQGSPNTWAKQAVAAYNFAKADVLVYESNQGGEMVAQVIESIDRRVNTRPVHASRGKVTRAEPVAARAEQGRIHHVGVFSQLEDELCEWTAGDPNSPNRLDAMVWGVSYLDGTTGTLDLPAMAEFRKAVRL